MASTVPIEATSGWKRWLANFTAFAEAAEMDGITYCNVRIANLERRIAQLESERARTVTTPSGG